MLILLTKTEIMETMAIINHLNFNYYFVIGGFFISYLVYRMFNSFLGDNNFIQIKYKLRGHTWRSIDCNKSIPYNIYVSLYIFCKIHIIIFFQLQIKFTVS